MKTSKTCKSPKQKESEPFSDKFLKTKNKDVLVWDKDLSEKEKHEGKNKRKEEKKEGKKSLKQILNKFPQKKRIDQEIKILAII